VGSRSGVGSAGAEQGPDPPVRAAHPQLAMGHRYGSAVSDRPRFPTPATKTATPVTSDPNPTVSIPGGDQRLCIGLLYRAVMQWPGQR
jgi:hypothetical protein